jgi:coenzyme F420-reducing hydrogenase alpha subunit
MRIRAHDLDVEVNHSIEISSNGLTVLKIHAVAGESKHPHTITIGAVDGLRPAPPSKDEIQKMLDDGRQYAALEAAWKECVRVAASQIS